MKHCKPWIVVLLALSALWFTTPAESRIKIKKDKDKPTDTTPRSRKPKKVQLPFIIYSEKTNRGPYIPSGWMGDYGDLKINDNYQEKPYSGTSCFQIQYTAERKNNAGWAGIYWQHPHNNWGNKSGGFNLSDAQKLVFWARGEDGGETIAEFKVGGIIGQDQPGDSDSISIGPIYLEKEWKKYEIDLKGRDLSLIIGAFAFSASADDNPEGFNIYLDDIHFE
jgi:hypothetical protein